MSKGLERLMSELCRSLPGDNRLEVTKIIMHSYKPDLLRDFGSAEIASGVGSEVAASFARMPTYLELSLAIRGVLGSGSQRPESPRAAEVWANAYLARWHLVTTRRGKAAARSVFLTYARENCPEAIDLVRERQPDALVARDEEKDDMDWWWDRVDALASIRDLSLRLHEAIGMHAVLTRPSAMRPGHMPHPRPQVVQALEEMIGGLRWQGIEPKGPATTPRSIHRAAPAPHGPSNAEAPASPVSHETQAPRPDLAAQIEEFRRRQGIVPKKVD